MTGFGILLGKELREQQRTMRIVVVTIVFLIFGIMSPATAKYLPEIIKQIGSGQIAITVPTPTVGDSVDQLLKNLGQFGVLAAILLTMGAVATEKERGTAAFILTKPASRAAFLGAKFIAISLTLLVATVLASAAGYYYTAILFSAPPAAGFAAMTLMLWLQMVVFAAFTFVGSVLTRGALPAAGVAIGVLIVTAIISALPTVGPFMPQSLLGPARSMGLGLALQTSDWLGVVVANLGIVALALVVSWAAFRNQEL